EPVDRHRQQVVRDVEVGLLVDVVTDTRPVREQVLDRDVGADEGKIVTQYRPSGGGQVEPALLDEGRDAERGQALGPAGDREPGVDRVRNPARPVREAVRLGQLDGAAAVHPYHSGEPGVGDR